MDKPRPHILEKPRFMESALQKWLAIFLVLGVGVGILGSPKVNLMAEPKAILDYILQLGSLYVVANGGINALRVTKATSLPTPDASQQ